MNETIRVIDGQTYRCRDVGCPNFKRAEANRKMVSNKENIDAYVAVERAVRDTPKRKRLPSWIPIGNMGIITDKELRQSGGDRFDIEIPK